MMLFSDVTLLEGIAAVIALQFFLMLWIIVTLKGQSPLEEMTSAIHQLQLNLTQANQQSQEQIQEKIAKNQLAIQQLITDSVQKQMTDVREQMNHSFTQHANSLTSHLQLLTEEIRNHLHHLTQQVNHKLSEGFEKTSTTFIDVVKRLTIIDEAQKKITELSNHVVSLQD